MSGSLYVIGIGPGDPELLTLKAVRIIGQCPVLCVPKGKAEGSSLALSIVQGAVALNEKEIIEAHFPMMKTRGKGTGRELDEQWDSITEMILDKINTGNDVAFPTLGDPTIYSTFFYLYERLKEKQPELNIEIVPGVSSINASAARANIHLGLGNDRIAVLPANYMSKLKSTLENFDTVVLMKVNKVLNEIVAVLSEMGLESEAVCVSRVGMDDEEVIHDITKIKQEELNYFSMIIVRK